MNEQEYIVFRGNRQGISIYFNKNAEYTVLKEQLIKRLEARKKFFAGAKVVNIQGKKLTKEEKEEIKEIIYSRFGIVMVEKKEKQGITKTAACIEKKIFNGIEEGNTKFIRATIRSGQKIIFSGNIVIIGDVNPGAEIIAEGNILVMGALRGIAHAGSTGNQKAYVVAYCLQPTQLRIAGVIARSPDHEDIQPTGPELARVKDHILVIEPYLPNK
jgi:septum site-determining protein MinC